MWPRWRSALSNASELRIARATWRSFLLILCTGAIVFTLGVIVDKTGFPGVQPWYGVWGTNFNFTSSPLTVDVIAVDPDGPSGRAGLRSGDILDLSRNSAVERYGIYAQPLSGRPVTLLVRRGNQSKRITVVPASLVWGRHGLRWFSLILTFGTLALLLLAGLILWRRPNAPGNLFLAAALIFYANPGNLGAPWAWPYAISFYWAVFQTISLACWAAFAGCFSPPPSRLRRAAIWVCVVLVGVDVVLGAYGETLLLARWPDLLSARVPALQYLPPLGPAEIVAAIIASALAIRESHGSERQRAAWSLTFLGVILVAPTVTNNLLLPQPSYSAYILLVAIGDSIPFIAAVLLTYIALNRRLIDIGFALNRTLIFAIITAIVVGAFIVVEWAASEWLKGATRSTSAIAGMAVALVLGLSLRMIHKYVDHFVDRAFFTKRHEDEAALRRFAHESSYITDPDLLLERAVEEVKQHTNVTEATILIRDGSAMYASAGNGVAEAFSENDPALVSLRAWGKPVDLHTVRKSSLHGELAFPMISRGTLVGALVCGMKRDGEMYAPDEAEALFALAHGVGTAYDTLSSRANNPSALVLIELAKVRAEVRQDRDFIIQELKRLSGRFE